jgi:hypothetical protein
MGGVKAVYLSGDAVRERLIENMLVVDDGSSFASTGRGSEGTSLPPSTL